jgi:hypothetical protein
MTTSQNAFSPSNAIYRRLDKGVAVRDSYDTRQVFKTKDYGRFLLAPENRVVNAAHVEALKKSLAENGFLADCPIHVIDDAANPGKLIVTDGQHRLMAAKSLGEDVYYIKKVDTDVSRDIRVMHTFSKSWTVDDYLHHFCQRGFATYLRLREFVRTFNIPPALGITVLMRRAHRAGPDAMHQFKTGGLQFSEADFDAASQLMRQVNDIRFLHDRLKPIAKDRTFIVALVYMITTADYNHDRMLRASEKQILNFVRCSRADQYLEIFSEIYNYQRKATNRVVFTKKGSFPATESRPSPIDAE